VNDELCLLPATEQARALRAGACSARELVAAHLARIERIDPLVNAIVTRTPERALAAADDLEKKMSAVEQQLIQVNMKGSEGNLAFPNMLNEEFDTFSHVIDDADTGPTQPEYELFKVLSGRLDEQLAKWSQLKTDDVPKVRAMIKQAEVPALSVDAKGESPK